ncbi:MAG: ornithine carbamoyltransferase [Paracoccaceae bacterium]
MRHFLDIDQIDYTDLRSIINDALNLKAQRVGFTKGQLDKNASLTGNSVALIFQKPSTRTRVSFDMGVRQLGGKSLLLSGDDMQLGHGESIGDTALVLSRYVDLMMLRTFSEETLYEMAKHASIPVINGLTDTSHPCQIMADILTYEEKRGSIKGKKVLWIGDGNNVCASLMQASEKFNFSVIFSGPDELDPDPNLVKKVLKRGASFEIQRNVKEAIKDVDLIITDSWVSMHHSELERKSMHNILQQYQVNKELIQYSKPDTLFMHCLPAHRGEEVTSEVLDGERSVVFDEAENRLHVQKSIMRWCLNKF